MRQRERSTAGDRDDRVSFFENGKHVRTEFVPGHAVHGMICFFEDGKHVRTEFVPGHPLHGHICFCKGGTHVRTEFAPSHPAHGTIHFFERGEHVRTEFAPHHSRHGETLCVDPCICSICFETGRALTDIHEGHTYDCRVCRNCFLKLSICPYCRAPL